MVIKAYGLHEDIDTCWVFQKMLHGPMDDVIPEEACLCVCVCVHVCMDVVSVSLCGYLTVKVSREMDDDSTWIWAEGRILLKRGPGHNIL